MRPRLVKVYAGALLLFDIDLLVMVIQALAAPPYVVLTDASAPAAALARVLNGVARVGLTAFAVLIVGSIVFTIRRWMTAARRNGSAISAAS